MEIREITPPQGSTRFIQQESIVKKFQGAINRPQPVQQPPAAKPTPPDPQPVTVEIRKKPSQDWLLPEHKPKLIIRSSPSQAESKVAFMQPATMIAPQPTPLPVYREPVPEYDYPDTDTAYPKKPSRFKMPSFYKKQQSTNLDTPNKLNVKSVGKLIGEVAVGVVLIYVGLTSTGSYWEPASRYSGELAQAFYGYQVGILMAIAGSILIYDAIKKAANL